MSEYSQCNPTFTEIVQCDPEYEEVTFIDKWKRPLHYWKDPVIYGPVVGVISISLMMIIIKISGKKSIPV